MPQAKEIPLTRDGTPDKRFNLNRPVTCKYCDQYSLYWRRPEDGSNRWRLVTRSGELHHCLGSRQRVPDPTTDEPFEPWGSMEQVTVPDPTPSNFSDPAIMEMVAKIEGRYHHKLPTLVRVLNQRLHVMMVGAAGSGKTTAASQAATALGLRYFEASMGPVTSQWDLIGYRSPDGIYIPGLIREPFENGGLLTLDELDNSNPSVLTVLNSALSNGHCSFPDAMIEKHPDFVLVGAGNTYGRGADRLYVGRNQLDAATLDRFAVIDWDYDEDAEIEWAGSDQLDWTRYVQRVRHAAMNHAMRVVISPRASIFGAKLLRAGMNLSEIEDMVLYKGMSSDDKTRLIREVR